MILLSVVAAIAGLFGAGGDVQVGGMSGRAISIVESSHRIEFPDRIVFTLEAEAPPDVQSATLYYTVGSHDVKVYAYPVRFSNLDNIEAEFVVNTGKDGFIPQGVEIEYYYVFADSVGNLITSGFALVRVPGSEVRLAAAGSGRLYDTLARQAGARGEEGGGRTCLCE